MKWAYTPPNPPLPPTNLIDNKLKEFDDVIPDDESRLMNFTIFSQVYPQRHASIKFEYEQKVVSLEKMIADNCQRFETHLKKLETENQNLFAHIVQLTCKTEIITENRKRKMPKITSEAHDIPSSPHLPTDINA